MRSRVPAMPGGHPVRQVNTSGSVLVCHEAGRDIGPGEELDHPTLITGCEPASEARTDSAAKPAKSKAAAGAGAVEGSAP
jgi:hypothetical protein